MKNNSLKIFCTAFLLLVCISMKAQSNFTSRQIGIGVVVEDMDRSLDFYINTLGMVKTGSFTINEDFGNRSGLTGGTAVLVNILKVENSPEATDWKLMSFGKKSTHPAQKVIQDDTGMQYITFQVKSLKPILDRLAQRQIPLLGNSPILLNKDAHFVLVQDPDGTFVELIGPLN
ncbi:VOC family protein [Arundinibacter roseus]|uniref:VOC family protein n=1 Tax=Arundinibacter roseus TaxID=2070510 RepID=A0A4V2XAG4_9BACT|nr:VOC family protein [Arundinibacter roseus]TDB67495.1 VOC family protein [Arundinibacter roseus]